MTIRLLDCTLRDGGYYNDWDYSADLIRHYVDSMERARVDVIEMGFRRFGADRYLGPTAFTTDEEDVTHLLSKNLMLDNRFN